MVIGTIPGKIRSNGEGWGLEIFGDYFKKICGNSRGQLNVKKEFAFPGVIKKSLGFWPFKFHEV